MGYMESKKGGRIYFWLKYLIRLSLLHKFLLPNLFSPAKTTSKTTAPSRQRAGDVELTEHNDATHSRASGAADKDSDLLQQGAVSRSDEEVFDAKSDSDTVELGGEVTWSRGARSFNRIVRFVLPFAFSTYIMASLSKVAFI